MAVTCWTRIGASGCRADTQRTTFVNSGNRTATGAYSVDVHYRNCDRQTRHRSFICHAQAIALAESDIGRGATHIEGNYFFEARGPCCSECAHNAPRRPGKNSAYRLIRGDGRGNAAAGRLHNAQSRRACCQALEISPHQRLEVGVDRYGGSALKLSIFRKNLVRNRQRDVENGEGARDLFLVTRIDKRKKQADSNG